MDNHDIQSVIEFGCGDGNQLQLADYPNYTGLDVSPTAIQKCQRLFEHDDTKEFHLYEPKLFEENISPVQGDLGLSLDVIFHLVEDDVYNSYMRHLFSTARRHVIIYSNNTNDQPAHLADHVRFRKFTDWIEAQAPSWKLVERVENLYPYNENEAEKKGSFADFFIFTKED